MENNGEVYHLIELNQNTFHLGITRCNNCNELKKKFGAPIEYCPICISNFASTNTPRSFYFKYDSHIKDEHIVKTFKLLSKYFSAGDGRISETYDVVLKKMPEMIAGLTISHRLFVIECSKLAVDLKNAYHNWAKERVYFDFHGATNTRRWEETFIYKELHRYDDFDVSVLTKCFMVMARIMEATTVTKEDMEFFADEEIRVCSPPSVAVGIKREFCDELEVLDWYEDDRTRGPKRSKLETDEIISPTQQLLPPSPIV